MVSPLMSITLSGDNRSINRYTPVVSPMGSASPIDARMTPIRKSLFQKRRLTSSKRRKESSSSFLARIEGNDDDDSPAQDIENKNPSTKRKGGQLKVLQERFNHIQKGLGSIDEERNSLVEKAKRLDDEKRMIQKQLEMREHEILTLIKRCASQEEKMRESSKLRSKNRELESHVESLSRQIEEIEVHQEGRLTLQRMLQESELDREQLKDRLAKVQREHDSIADTLQECLGKIRQLTDEKHAIEEERRRERKRAELELEKQQLEHVNDSNILKHDIQAHQSKIDQMEKILQDNMKSNTALRREKAVMSQERQDEIQGIITMYEQQLNDLKREMEETKQDNQIGIESTTGDFEEKVQMMSEKLKSKENQIEELETDFSEQMIKLMSTQTNLDKAEEEKRNLESKLESFQSIEVEHAALLDFVEILDSNLAELTSVNANLELEKDDLLEETTELRKKASMLQQQFSSLQNTKKAKENDFRDLLNTEKEELRKELEDCLVAAKAEVVSLKVELQNRNERISRLEIELRQARKLIIEKEDEICRILNEMDIMSSNLGSDLKEARSEVRQFETEVFAKEQKLAAIEGHLEGAKEMHEVEKKTTNNDAHRQPSIQLCEPNGDSAIGTERRTNDELEKRIKILEKELSEAQTSRSESMANLEKARGRIEQLEKQLIGEDPLSVSLDKQLQEATMDLSNKMSEACFVEETYDSNVQLQVEREMCNSEALSKIEELENEILELKDLSNQLDIQMKESLTANAEKDETILALNNELADRRKETEELICDVATKNNELKNLDAILDQKEKSIQLEIQNAFAELSKKEELIEELKIVVSKNEEKAKLIESALSEAKGHIKHLEETISHKDDELRMFTEKLNTVEQESINSNQRYSSDKKELEKKIQALMSSETDLSTQLEGIRAKLEEERNSWIVKEESSNQELSNLRENILELQQSLSEQEKLVSTLRDDEKEGVELNVEVRTRLSEAESIILELREKIERDEKRMEDLEREVGEKTDDIVQSQHRRVEVEMELENAQQAVENLTTCLNNRNVMFEDADNELKKIREDVKEKDERVLVVEATNEKLQDEVELLNEELQVREGRLIEATNEIQAMKAELLAKNENVSKLHCSIKSLEGRANQSKTEITLQNDAINLLKETADELKSDLLQAESHATAKDEMIKSLESDLRTQKELEIKLEDEITTTKEQMKQLQKVTEDLQRQLEEERQGQHDNALYLTKLKGAEELTASLADEVTTLREEAFQQRLERNSEKESFLLEIESLKSELEKLSSKNKAELEQRENHTNMLARQIASFESSKQELETKLVVLNDTVKDRDATIEQLKQSVLLGQQKEEDAKKEIGALEKAVDEARSQLESMNTEHESKLVQIKVQMEIMIQNKYASHREELETALSELQSTITKLEDSESLLAEKSHTLDELVERNSGIELALEEEQSERTRLEQELANQHNHFETARIGLEDAREDFRRKESILESKLREERSQKHQSEESLKLTTKKLKEAMVTKKNFDDLEKENRELKDKISRQEAYLKRKLQREKADRMALTPSKSTASPSKNIVRTPPQRISNSSTKILPPSSAYSRSRLQAPASNGRGIPTGIPSSIARKPRLSPPIPSSRLSVSPKSPSPTGRNAKTNQYHTPIKRTPLSALDILQSELDDDQSATSELSSILGSNSLDPPAGARIPDWELESGKR